MSSAVAESHIPRSTNGGLKLYLDPAEFIGSNRDFVRAKAAHGTFCDVPAKFPKGRMAGFYPQLCRPGGLRGASMAEEIDG